MDECIDRIGTHVVPEICSSKKFPMHPCVSMRGVCGSNLVKRIKSSSQKEMFKPIKVYCYKSISSSITNILSRPAMLGVCEQWRERDVHDVYADIYDGAVWHDFKSSGFFEAPHSYGL